MSRDNVEIVQRHYAIWNRGAFDDAMELYDPEIEYVRTGSTVLSDFAGSSRGVDEMRKAVAGYLENLGCVSVRACGGARSG